MIRGRRVGIPMVSVILVINGDADNLHNSMRSLLEQSFANIEIIVVNTSPTFERKKMLKAFRDLDARIKVFHMPKVTPFQKAADFGIDKAKGEFIVFTDQSHIHGSTRIASQLRYLKRRIDHIATFCRSTVQEMSEKKPIDYFPFSLMLARTRIPFRFNPYDARCIRELPSFGKVGVVHTNLLLSVNARGGRRAQSDINPRLAASFTSHAKAYLQKKRFSLETVKKLLSDFFTGIRLAKQ